MANGPAGLIREVADLVQDLQHKHVELNSVLAKLTNSAVDIMPGAQHAGITRSHRSGKVQSLSATGRCPEFLDEIQQRHAQGPCLSAAREHTTIRIDDLEIEERWPYYCRDALVETPIRSVISFQLLVDRNHVGALSFYAEAPRVFDADAAEIGYLLATHAAVAWNIVRRDEQFRSALASRDVIGQAKGIIMERFKIGATQAFELLKRLSQSSNTPLAEVAHKLVESEQL